MNVKALFHLKTLELLRTLGGQNDGFNASFIPRNYTAEEKIERMIYQLAEADDDAENPIDDPLTATTLDVVIQLSLHDMLDAIVKRLQTKCYRKAAKIRTGSYTEDGEPIMAYFRSSVYEHPNFRKAVINRILPLAHRLGKEYPAPNENSSWRLLRPEEGTPEVFWQLHEPEMTLTQFRELAGYGHQKDGQPQNVTDTLDRLDADAGGADDSCGVDGKGAL